MKRIVVSTMAATVAAGVAVAGVFSLVHKHGTPTMRQSSATTSAAANAGVANTNTGTPSQNQIASPFNDANNQTQPAVASGPSSDNSGATSTQRNTLPNQPGSNPASATSGPATQSATQSAGQTFSGTDNHTTQNSGPAPASIHLTYKGIDGLGYDQDPTAPLEVNERFGERLVFTIRDTNGNPIPGVTLHVTSSNNAVVEPDFDTKPSPVDGMPEDINTTDHNGQVVVHVYANGEAGSATVTAASGSIRTSVPLRVVPWAAHATVTITHTTLTADSGQVETVTARVTDKNGSPIEGLTLFPCTGEPNSLNVPVTMRLVTDANGEVHYDITPGNMPSLAAYLGVDDPRTHPWVVEVQVNHSNH